MYIQIYDEISVFRSVIKYLAIQDPENTPARLQEIDIHERTCKDKKNFEDVIPTVHKQHVKHNWMNNLILFISFIYLLFYKSLGTYISLGTVVAVIKKAGVCFMFLPIHDLIDMQAGLPSSTYWLSLYMYIHVRPTPILVHLFSEFQY